MSLKQYDYFIASDLNNIKDRIIAECTRRSASANSYNTNPMTVPTINAVTANTTTWTASYMNQILTQLKYFNVFPGTNLLNTIYHDGVVNKADIIYALENIKTILTTIEDENRQNNDDCVTGCMGLCTNACRNACTGCTSCTSCSGCSSCQGCSGCSSCQGCSGCGSGCASGCTGGCNSCEDCEGCWGASGGGPGFWW